MASNLAWNETTLLECTSDGLISYGVVQPGSNVAEGIPIVRVNNITEEGIATDTAMRILPEIEASYQRTRLRGGELLLTLVGTTGNVAIVPPEMNGWNVARAIAVIRPKSSVGAQWLKLCLESSSTREYLNARANTTVQKTLNLGDVKRLPIPMPPAAWRNEIISVISPLDQAIALCRQQNANLEQIARAIFKSWFVDFDPVWAKVEGREPEGMDAATAALFSDSFVNSPFGLIPSGWRSGNLGELMEMQGGTQPPAAEFIDEPRDGYVRLLQIRDYATEAHATYIPHTKKLRLVTADDVLIGRYGSGSGDAKKDSMGRYLRGLEGAINVAIVKVLPAKLIYKEWIAMFVESGLFYRAVVGGSARAVQAGFRQADLARVRIALPADELLAAFDELARAFWVRREDIRKQAATLSSIRDTLLPRLISGKLRVTEAEKLVGAVL